MFINNQDDDHGVSKTFNVVDLTPYFGLEESESRMTPFQGGWMIWPRRPHQQVTYYNLKFKLHQLKYHLQRHQPNSLTDQLCEAELRNYNKRWTRYFVKIILILMRIIYCLSHAHCYCSGSPRRMARIQKEKNIEKDHDQTRPVLQNSLKEAVIIFHSQKL